MIPAPADVIFINGLVPLSEEKMVVLRSLQINERKLALEVEGDSDVASRVYDETMTILASLNAENDLTDLEPLLFAEETSCVATLDLEWSDLFPVALAKNLVSATTSERGESEINGAKVEIDLRFVTSKELRENRITLSNKSFVLEPRQQEAFSKHRFRCASPLGSAEHLRLLKKLERALKKKK